MPPGRNQDRVGHAKCPILHGSGNRPVLWHSLHRPGEQVIWAVKADRDRYLLQTEFGAMGEHPEAETFEVLHLDSIRGFDHRRNGYRCGLGAFDEAFWRNRGNHDFDPIAWQRVEGRIRDEHHQT